MADAVGHDRHDATTSAPQTPIEDEYALPVDAEARARFEHEAAVLDLSEAEQLAVWSAFMAEQGDATESRRLAGISARLRESADRHRHHAERLEAEADQHG